MEEVVAGPRTCVPMELGSAEALEFGEDMQRVLAACLRRDNFFLM